MCDISTSLDGRRFVRLCGSFGRLSGARIYCDQGAPPLTGAGCWDKVDVSRITVGELVVGQGDRGSLGIRFQLFTRRK